MPTKFEQQTPSSRSARFVDRIWEYSESKIDAGIGNS